MKKIACLRVDDKKYGEHGYPWIQCPQHVMLTGKISVVCPAHIPLLNAGIFYQLVDCTMLHLQ